MDMFNTEMMFTIGLLNTFFYVQHVVYVVVSFCQASFHAFCCPRN